MCLKWVRFSVLTLMLSEVADILCPADSGFSNEGEGVDAILRISN